MSESYNFLDELYKLVYADPVNVIYQLDEQFKRAVFSTYEDEKYQDLLAQYKVIYKVYRNSEGKHKVVKK